MPDAVRIDSEPDVRVYTQLHEKAFVTLFSVLVNTVEVVAVSVSLNCFEDLITCTNPYLPLKLFC